MWATFAMCVCACVCARVCVCACRYQTRFGFGFSATLGTYDNITGLDIALVGCGTRVGWTFSSDAGGYRAGCACENGPPGLLCSTNLEGTGSNQWIQVIYWMNIWIYTPAQASTFPDNVYNATASAGRCCEFWKYQGYCLCYFRTPTVGGRRELQQVVGLGFKLSNNWRHPQNVQVRS